jgi:hypothetical protein
MSSFGFPCFGSSLVVSLGGESSGMNKEGSFSSSALLRGDAALAAEFFYLSVEETLEAGLSAIA